LPEKLFYYSTAYFLGDVLFQALNLEERLVDLMKTGGDSNDIKNAV